MVSIQCMADNFIHELLLKLVYRADNVIENVWIELLLNDRMLSDTIY